MMRQPIKIRFGIFVGIRVRDGPVRRQGEDDDKLFESAPSAVSSGGDADEDSALAVEAIIANIVVANGAWVTGGRKYHRAKSQDTLVAECGNIFGLGAERVPDL